MLREISAILTTRFHATPYRIVQSSLQERFVKIKWHQSLVPWHSDTHLLPALSYAFLHCTGTKWKLGKALWHEGWWQKLREKIQLLSTDKIASSFPAEKRKKIKFSTTGMISVHRCTKRGKHYKPTGRRMQCLAYREASNTEYTISFQFVLTFLFGEKTSIPSQTYP